MIVSGLARFTDDAFEHPSGKKIRCQFIL
jgi:hypothetical protein